MTAAWQSNWTYISGDEYRRTDGVVALKRGSGRRPWFILRGTHEYLRGKLYADSDIAGGVRTFGSLGKAILAADTAWPA